MQYADLRLVELQERNPASTGGVLGGIALAVGGSAMLAIGYYIKVKFFNQVDQSDFTADQNTTYDDLQGDTDDVFDMTTLMLWVAIGMTVLVLVLGGFMAITR